MFTQFGATAETLSKASSMVFRIGTDAHLYDDPEDANIVPLLDSKFDSEKIEALKRLLALIAQGFDVSNYFPQVVKNVASQSLEVKKLVYVYLLHYAEKRPNEALLSINYFQKDLGDTNPLVRAWALRTMSGIRLHVVAPLVLIAVNKCARDLSVYVRKCAANALPKLNDLRLEENASTIEEIIGILLNDNSPGVVGAAAAAFNSICPNNLTLIARSYRRLCETLPDVEEWGQIILIGILLRFVIARHGLVKESLMFSCCAAGTNRQGKAGQGTDNVLSDISQLGHGNSEAELAGLLARSYTEGPDEYLSHASLRNRTTGCLDDASFTYAESNDDVKILLKSTSPLLWSHNSAVVLAAAAVHWIMAPKDDVNRIVKPLLFVLRSSLSAKFVVLCNILVFAKVMPSLFADYYEDFFIWSSEPYQIKALKLEILSLIATDTSIPFIFQEFQDYIRDPDRRLAADTVAAIGLCTQRLPKIANMCLEGLLSLTREFAERLADETIPMIGEAEILIQAVMSIKSIINQDPLGREKVIIQMVRSLDVVKVPAARAVIIWLVGEYCSIGERIPWMLTSVLKYLSYCFKSEASETKLQILNTATKVLLRDKREDQLTINETVSFVLELAKCDMNYDVRDRARALTKIVSTVLGSDDHGESDISSSKEATYRIADKIFGAVKDLPSSVNVNDHFYLPGSLSQIVLHAAPGYEPLPKPRSLVLTDVNSAQGKELSEDSSVTYDSEATSSSLDTEDASDDGFRLSESDTNIALGSENSGVLSANENTGILIQISEAGDDTKGQDGGGDSSIHAMSGSGGVEDMFSKRYLESWLGEEPLLMDHKPSEHNLPQRSASISIPDLDSRVKPESYTLLDSASGQGLKVDFSFSSQISDISPLLVCVEVSFQNCSDEPFSEVKLVDEGSNKDPGSKEQALSTTESLSASHADVPTLVPMEQIDSLEPGQTIKRVLHVRFHHHLLPLKLSLWFNCKNHAVKLRPDIGYFVKPLPMDIATFKNKESQLRGMFEYERRCTFAEHIVKLNISKSDNTLQNDAYLVICESLALKMLSNANIFLVSVDLPLSSKLDDASGLCLRFSAQILSSSVPCLITVVVEGNCLEPLDVSVKVNSEETVFGLNLLNRVVNLLAESSSSDGKNSI